MQQMRKENLTFSRKGEEEMNLYGAAIRDILTRTTDAFVNNDQALAHTVEPLEEVIDELNKDVKKHHMKRLRKGKCSMELGLILSDLAMNYERVADHCSNIAVYMWQLKVHSWRSTALQSSWMRRRAQSSPDCWMSLEVGTLCNSYLRLVCISGRGREENNGNHLYCGR